MLPFFLVAILLVANAVEGSPCPEGWSLFENECIKSFMTRKTFDLARASCQAEKGDLVKITNGAQNSFVSQTVSRAGYWIGGWDDNKDGRFTYVDGSAIGPFVRWNQGEPNNWGGNERCLMSFFDGSGSSLTGNWNDARCSNSLAYICSRPKEICSEGWTFYEPDHTCLKRFSTRKSFDSARATCKSFNADLMKLRNAEQNMFVSRLVTRGASWIGAWDDDKNGQFTYVDGSPLGSFRPWNRGEPNNSGGNERCVMNYYDGTHRTTTGTWNDAVCSALLPFICATEPCPEGWSLYQADNTCVKRFDSRKGFTAARATCQAAGADLVEIKDSNLNNFLSKMVGTGGSWIGGWDDNKDGQFTYLDGSALGSFKLWSLGEPNNWGGNERCLMNYYDGSRGPSTGKWNDAVCSVLLPFICSGKVSSVHN